MHINISAIIHIQDPPLKLPYYYVKHSHANFRIQTIIPRLQNASRISGSLLPHTNLTNMATMPKELKHFQDICTDCTFQKHLNNKNARTISALRIKLNKWFETVDVLNGFTKALPYPK